MYVNVDNCKAQTYDFLTGTKSRPDLHCHVGQCKRLAPMDEPGDEKKKDDSSTAMWGLDADDGCPTDPVTGNAIENCCNDKFLSTMCINSACTEVNRRLEGHVRLKDPTFLAKKGFGIAVRNMMNKPIKLTGTVEIRKLDYPCTLSDCCGDLGLTQPATECCSRLYPRVFAAGEACEQCGPVPAPGVCHPNEVYNLPSWTSRGPGQSNYLEGIGGRQFKPELVAPGIQVVSASSDGFNASVGEPEDFEVQCGLPSASTVDPTGCFIGEASQYRNTSAVRAKSGSSIAAALVAGSAALIRQYLADGYYPSGLKDPKPKYANPTAALVKAMLINSARSVGGNTDTYTYKVRHVWSACIQLLICASVRLFALCLSFLTLCTLQYPPFCDPTIQVCAPWTKPTPDKCETDPTFENVDCFIRRDRVARTPNNIEGFGRPFLKNVLWTSDSEYSIFFEETYVPNGYQRSYSFPILATSPDMPLKVTVAWTGSI